MEQLPLWKAERRFVRLLFSMVDKLQMAKMGSNAFAVLIVIRRFVPMSGGSSFPSAQKIAKYTNLSPATVYKQIKLLETLGWLKKTKDGRKNKYELKEHVYATSTNPNKRPDKVLQMPFGVADWKRNEGYIEEFEHTGEIPDYAPITIQNATFHVTINNYNDKSQHVEVKLDASVLEDVKNPYYKKWLREKMEKQAEQVTLDAVADTPDKTKP